MKIWHLHWLGAGGYDQFSDFVVVAPCEETARAAVRCADECRDNRDRSKDSEEYDGAHQCVWHSPAFAACTIVGEAAPGVPEGVLCESFHAG
jgi:hypothetical protein